MPDHPDPAIPGSTQPYEEFVRLFVAHEGRLRAFIRSLLPTWADVDEVMQETSLVAWRKFSRFERGTNFMAWAATIARFEALDHLRRRGREQLVFSTAVVTAQYTLATAANLREFVAVRTVNLDPMALAVKADAPWKTLRELVDAQLQSGLR